jgi:hypothetical protein
MTVITSGSSSSSRTSAAAAWAADVCASMVDEMGVGGVEHSAAGAGGVSPTGSGPPEQVLELPASSQDDERNEISASETMNAKRV